MNPILFSLLEYQGKSLLYNNIKSGMTGNEILQVFSCALEELYGKLDLSCVDFSKIGLILSTCSDEDAKVTLCQLFNYLASKIFDINTRLNGIDAKINEINKTLSDFTDKYVAINALDLSSGYLADKLISDQPNTLSINPTNSKMILHGFIPIGGIMYYDSKGSFSNFDPTGKGKINTDVWGFAMCNGSNGTHDLNGKFIKGSSTLSEQFTSAGNDQISISKTNLPTDSFSVSIAGNTSANSHSHTYLKPDTKIVGKNAGSGEGAAADTFATANTSTETHTHSISGSATLKLNDGSQEKINLDPSHTKLLLIQRIF